MVSSARFSPSEAVSSGDNLSRSGSKGSGPSSNGGAPFAIKGSASTFRGSGMMSAIGSLGGSGRRGSVMSGLLVCYRCTSPWAGNTRDRRCKYKAADRGSVRGAQMRYGWSQDHRGDSQGKALLVHRTRVVWYPSSDLPFPTVPYDRPCPRPGLSTGALVSLTRGATLDAPVYLTTAMSSSSCTCTSRK